MQKPKKVSYIRKPFAKRSFMAIGLAAAALILGGAGLGGTVRTGGQAQLNMAAACFCSLVVALVSMVYGVLSLFEREKKYILARIALGVSGFLVVLWVILIIVGFRR